MKTYRHPTILTSKHIDTLNKLDTGCKGIMEFRKPRAICSALAILGQLHTDGPRVSEFHSSLASSALYHRHSAVHCCLQNTMFTFSIVVIDIGVPYFVQVIGGGLCPLHILLGGASPLCPSYVYVCYICEAVCCSQMQDIYIWLRLCAFTLSH